MAANARVLIVDDDANARRELALILSEKEYEIETAGAGSEALEKARELFFHLALIDSQLPDRVGAELIAPLQEMRPDMVVVVVAASGSVETEVRALNAGATAFIAKPWHKDQVLAITRQALEKQRLIMEHRQLLAEVGQELVECARAEDTLRESEERFRQLAEAAFEGIVISDQGKILDANVTFAKMYGYTPIEVIGKAVMDLVAPESRELVFTNIRSGSEKVYEHMALRKDGSTFPVEVRGKAIAYKERFVWVTAVRVITERVQAVARLPKLSRAVENSISAVVIYDMGGVIEYVNPRFVQMTGYAHEEIIGTHVSNLGNNTAEEDKEIWDTILANGEWRGEILNRKKSGEPYWVSSSISSIRDAQGAITHFVEVHVNITEHKQSVEALRQRNRELSLLNRVIASAASTTEPATVLETVCRELAQTFDLPQAAAALIDEEGTNSVVVAEYLATGRPSALGIHIPVRDNPAMEYVLAHKIPLVIPDVQVDKQQQQIYDVLRQRGTVSLLIVPVILHDQVVGTIGLDAVEQRKFREEEITLAVSAVTTAAQVLEKAQFLTTEQRDAKRLTDIFELSTDLALLRGERDLLNTLVNRAAAFTGSPICSVLLLDETANEAVLVAQAGLPEGMPPDLRIPLTQPIVSRSLETGEPIIISDVDHDAPEMRAFLVHPEIRAFFAYPLVIEGRTVGFMTLSSLTPYQPSITEVTAYCMQAEWAALALQNARLFVESKRRAKELETLREASLQLTSSLNPQEVLTAILHNAIQLADARDAHAFLYDEQKLSFGAAIRLDSKDQQEVYTDPRPGGFTETVARTGKRLAIPDVNNHPLFADWHWGGAIIGLPFIVGGRTLGVMTVAFSKPRTFEESELRTLDLLAVQAAVALDNSRLFDETRRRAEELEAMVKVSSALRTALSQADMLPIVLDEVLTLLNVEGIALVMHDSDNGENIIELARGAWRNVTGLRMPPNHSITKQVFDSGQPLLFEDKLPSDAQPLQTGPLGGFSIAACVPLIVQEKTIGVLWVGRGEDITQGKVQLLSAIADIVANAIQRARLYEQTLRHTAELESRVAERTAALSIANAELARASRAKDEFLANMSHELRTPLSNVLIRVELLQKGIYGPPVDKQMRALQVIEDSGRHLLQLINDILDVSKIEAGKLELDMQPVSATSVCESSLRFVKDMAAQKGIQINSDIPSVVVQADGRLLKQILVNLLSNAVKFTPVGGQVGLEVSVDAEAALIQFAVSDTGIGIASDDMVRLFQPFSQLDGGLTRKFEGTGLGLALVRRLTEIHGGNVGVESEVGQGSRFTVSLPWHPERRATGRQELVVAEKEEQKISVDPPEAQSRDHSATILLAEDNEDLIIAIAHCLDLCGYRVIVARDGTEAVQRAKEFVPDIILMDIQMPGMDGLEAIRRIRADTDSGAVPIVALTALAMSGDRDRCIEVGASEYVSKPIAFEQLENVIETLLDEAGSKEKPSQ